MAGQEVSTAGAGSAVDKLIYDCNALRAELRGARSLLESLEEYGLATLEGEILTDLGFLLEGANQKLTMFAGRLDEMR